MSTAHAVATKNTKNDAAASRNPKNTQVAPEIIPETQTGFPEQQLLLQRKENACSCGGACPKCLGTLGVQTKLKIGAPNDKYEQEADRVADRVMRMSEPQVQRQETVKEYKEKNAILQTKIPSSSTTALSPASISGFEFLKAGGKSLPGPERRFFESRFKHNFGNVKIHQEHEDALLADGLQAQALTYGNHIYLGSKNKISDHSLMAHELTHVMQQHNGLNLRKASFKERLVWLAFFDHYLPRKFLNNYMNDTGKAITLKVKEMQDCNPIVDIRNSRTFMKDVSSLGISGGGSKTSKWSGWGGARTNGTLGNFTIKYQGTLTVNVDGTWHFSGKMTFYDYWDFNTGGKNRPLPAEVKVQVAAAFLPGKPFNIYSQQVAVSQSSSGSRAAWGAKAPVSVPDKATGVDV